MDISDNFDFHENAYMIYNDRYVERYEYACRAFKEFGLSQPKKLVGYDIKDYQFQFLATNPVVKLNRTWIIPNKIGQVSKPYMLALMLGHLTGILIARHLDLPYVVMFENDAYPRVDVLEKLKHYLSCIPDDAAVLQLGWTEKNTPAFFHKVDENFSEATMVNGKGAHSYIVFKQAYNAYIRCAFQCRNPDLLLTSTWFGSNLRVYTTNENLFIQVSKNGQPFEYPTNSFDGYNVTLDNDEMIKDGSFVLI